MLQPNQQALLSQLGGPPKNTGISGYGQTGGAEAPPIQGPSAQQQMSSGNFQIPSAGSGAPSGGALDGGMVLGSPTLPKPVGGLQDINGGGYQAETGSLTSPLAAPAGSALGAAPDALAAPKTYQALPGWETDRLNDVNDKSGKYVYQRWLQDNGYGQGGDKTYNADAVRAFMGSDEGKNWEMRGGPGDQDPNIRQKQEYLSSHDPGRQTQWQDVIRDSGPGGANGMSFSNADPIPGEPLMGQGEMPMRTALGGGMPQTGGLDPLLSGDPMQKILAAIRQHGGGRANAEALLGKLGGR